MTTPISLPVSFGEAFDKLSILQIKLKYITDKDKLQEVKKEHTLLLRGLQPYVLKVKYFYRLLMQCNEHIWHLCDTLRGAGLEKGKEYSLNCIAIIEANDSRFRLKEKINNLLHSTLKEVKSYAATRFHFVAHDMQYFLRNVGFIRKQSTLHDIVQIAVPSELLEIVSAFLMDDRSIILSVIQDNDYKIDNENKEEKDNSTFWHCGVAQKEVADADIIFSTVGEVEGDKVVNAAGDDLAYLDILMQAQELHMSDGLLYACLPYIEIKAQKKYWYGTKVPAGWSVPVTKVLYPHLGLGDLLITRALTTGKVKWLLDEQLIEKYRTHNKEYSSLIGKVLTDLGINFQWIKNLPTGSKYDDVNSLLKYKTSKNSILQKDIIRNLLYGVADFKESESYIVFHTKSRLDEERGKLDMKALQQFLQNYTTKKTIVLLGERVIDDNYENKYHQVVSLYSSLLALKANNKVFDRTVENIQAASNYDLLQRDIAIIREADLNINFGYGGNFVLSTLLGKRSINFVAGLNHPYFALLPTQHILYTEIKDLFTAMQKDVVYNPRGEQGLIERWAAINAKETSALQSYIPTCPICGCRGIGSAFKEIRAQDMFHAGELIRYICSQCGVTFGPRKVLQLDDRELEHDYRDLYSYYKEGNTEPMEVELLQMLKMSKNEKYLLYGCRQNNVIKRLRVEGYQVYGFDPYAEEGEFLISNYSQLRHHTFKGIVSNNLLEHLKDPIKEIKLMTNLLSEDGQMIHATPCLDYTVEGTHYHLFFFTGRSLEEICKRTGLSSQVHKNKILGGITTSYVIFKKHSNKFYGQWDPPVDKFLLENFFPNHYGLTAIECGAFDGVTENCTKYFEDNYGWKIINVEPVPSLYTKLCNNRPKSINLNYALSDIEGSIEFKQMIHPVHGDMFGNGSIKHNTEHLAELMKIPGMNSRTLTIQRKRYSTLIAEQKLNKVDLMILDVEGHEMEVLKDLVLASIKPQVLVVEFPHITLPTLRTILESHYIFNTVSHNNAYFTLKKRPPLDVKTDAGMKQETEEKGVLKFTDGGNFWLFACPTCLGGIQVEKGHVACGIFRHATYARDGSLVPPHTSRAECEKLVANGEARGCVSPFRFDPATHTVSRCDYI